MARWTASAKWAAGPALDGQCATPLGLSLSEGLGRTWLMPLGEPRSPAPLPELRWVIEELFVDDEFTFPALVCQLLEAYGPADLGHVLNDPTDNCGVT